MSVLAWSLALALLVAVAAGCGLLFSRVWTGASVARAWAARLLLLLASAASTFLVLELAFMVVPPQTDAWAFTLASRRWQERYFHPTNSLGFRDDEHTAEELARRPTLLALGDSFTAGWGLRDYRDRYQNVLAERLGPEWLEVTRAHGGWHTGNQLHALSELEFRPKIAVLQYYINDIEGAAKSLGATGNRDRYIPPPPAVLRPLVEHSLLADFVYWRVIRYAARDMNSGYRNTVYSLFDSERVWKDHRRALRGIMAWSREFRVPLFVLAIPHLVDQEASREPLERVMEVFRARGVPVVDVGARVRGRDPASLVVNRLDSHANEALHAEMAGWLHAEIAATLARPADHGAPVPSAAD